MEDRVLLKTGEKRCIDGKEVKVISKNVNDIFKGSSCTVYYGEIVKQKTPVIIKELNSTDSKDKKNAEEQFKRSIRVQKKLLDTGIREIIPGILLEELPYVVMEFHEGVDLKKTTTDSSIEKLRISYQLCKTIETLHNEEYLMTDIKPENLLWCRNPGRVYIVDLDSIIKYGDKPKYFNEKYGHNGEFYIYDVRAVIKIIKEILFDNDDIILNSVKYNEKDIVSELRSFKEFLNKALEENINDVTKKYADKILGEIKTKLHSLIALANDPALQLKLEIAESNARLASYNILEKYPLYNYADKNKISVLIAGSHDMREGVITSLIEIGQITGITLNIDIIDLCGNGFIDKFFTKHSSLSNAVTLEINDEQSDLCMHNSELVQEPLAKIRVFTEPESCSDCLGMEDVLRGPHGCYFLMDNLEEENVKNIEIIADSNKEKKILVGYCSSKEYDLENIREKLECMNIAHISDREYTEKYNQDMFENLIYYMGYLVHCYFQGYEDVCSLTDFKKDMYNVLSSERSALHGNYKLASINIYKNTKDRVRKYIEQVDNNPEVCEELARLEHISWSAHMLTNGWRRMDLSDVSLKNGGKNKDEKTHACIVAFNKMPDKKLKDVLIEAGNLRDASNEGLDPLDDLSLQKAKKYLYEIEKLLKNFVIDGSEKEIKSTNKTVDLIEQIMYKNICNDKYEIDIREVVENWKKEARYNGEFDYELKGLISVCLNALDEKEKDRKLVRALPCIRML